MAAVKTIFALGLLSLSCTGGDSAAELRAVPAPAVPEIEAPCALDTAFLRAQAAEARRYCRTQKADTQLYFLVDLARHSGCNRFFIWDFEKDALQAAFPVSHGCASYPWGRDDSKKRAELSNEEGSHASSKGKYLIGARGKSSWGIGVNYLLHGKEKSNNNALRRQVVLHSWEAVADGETYPQGTPEGWGCPAVSNENMRLLDNVLIGAKRPVLLWVVQE